MTVNVLEAGTQFKVEEGVVYIGLSKDRVGIFAEKSLVESAKENMLPINYALGIATAHKITQDPDFNQGVINWFEDFAKAEQEKIKASAANEA